MSKILVIEDELALCEEIEGILTFEDHYVVVANNGLDGVKLAKQHLPDLIICDIAMPEMDGYETLLTLRADPTTTMTPFVFLSARAEKSFVRQGMELGADDYLTKPFTHSELLAAVNTRLVRHSDVTQRYENQVTELKESFARTMVHELRTPFSTISMVKTLIERKVDTINPDELLELLSFMNSGVERFGHVINQQTYLAQIESGLLDQKSVNATSSLVPVEQVINRAISTARQFAYQNRNNNIDTFYDDRLIMITAFFDALQHALAEVISNALNFSRENEAVTISVTTVDNYAHISVIDSGIGLSTQDQEKLFEKFVQINRATQEQQGVGMGLYVARAIIEAHGGSLNLTSNLDEGTTINVMLPLA